MLPQVTDEVCTRSGGPPIITWSSTPLRDPDGVVVSAARLGEDVTDRLRAERALRDSEQRRRMVTAEMLRTAEEERTRIAVELHDDTVQVMAATLMSLDRLSAALKAGDGERAGSCGACRTRHAGGRGRAHPPADVRAAAAAAGGAGARPGPARPGRHRGQRGRVRGVGRHPGRPLPGAVETLAYRTAQEAIVNVRKHAGARHLRLVLCEEAGGLQRRGLRRRPRLRPRPRARPPRDADAPGAGHDDGACAAGRRRGGRALAGGCRYHRALPHPSRLESRSPWNGTTPRRSKRAGSRSGGTRPCTWCPTRSPARTPRG